LVLAEFSSFSLGFHHPCGSESIVCPLFMATLEVENDSSPLVASKSSSILIGGGGELVVFLGE